MGLADMLKDMVLMGASDIHITVERHPTYRILGKLKVHDGHKPMTTKELDG